MRVLASFTSLLARIGPSEKPDKLAELSEQNHRLSGLAKYDDFPSFPN
jgi:hypothetical protein